MEEIQATVPAPVLVSLDVPRVIALKTKGVEFKYKTRRVTQKDWEARFQGIVDQSMRVDGELQKVFDAESSLVELADRVLVSADDGVHRAFSEPKVLPFSHRLAVGKVLSSVAAVETEELLCDLVTVEVAAIWPTDDASLAYEKLIHRFRQPSIEDLKRYRFECARVRVAGDGKNSVTRYPSRLAISLRLYDDLIASVDGYAVNGAALEGKENIVREMDGAHKAIAALHLFTRDYEVDF
jgi:hypothetical protein